VRAEVRLSLGGQQDEDLVVSLIASTHDEPPSIGILPDGEARAGRAPGVEHLGVGARRPADPLEEIEYEGLDGVRQQDLPRKTSKRSPRQ
jgi:hypothetical protein